MIITPPWRALGLLTICQRLCRLGHNAASRFALLIEPAVVGANGFRYSGQLLTFNPGAEFAEINHSARQSAAELHSQTPPRSPGRWTLSRRRNRHRCELRL